MNLLVIGSGAREHAIAWKLKQSPHVEKLYIAPGNAGTARIATNVVLEAQFANLEAFVTKHSIGLVVVGPEAPLAEGIADRLRALDVPVFGPEQRAAEIESSKRFAKDFMKRHGIPTARYEAFRNVSDALNYIANAPYPFVIKASGLAAGKGVILPETLDEARAAVHQIMVGREFGAAGDEVVIEERLSGEEVSVLAFCDGVTVKAMPAARDHKRLLGGDLGPNTGGMGAIAPVVLPHEVAEKIQETILQPTIDGLGAEGRAFVGVLYPGLMLTVNGPKVLEFNCRFGDPEAEVVLRLLDTDLLEILLACVNGTLNRQEIRWKRGAAACVILASGGYPGKYATGVPIHGLDASLNRHAVVFHAGTKLQDQTVVTNGGRVLAVTGWGETLGDALDTAYAAIRPIHFEGMQYRKDIGANVGAKHSQ
jgi:phosphoribosylamine--glycine ligase